MKLRCWVLRVKNGTALCVVTLAGVGALGCSGSNASEEELPCYPVDAYRINVADDCFEAATSLSDVCLLETRPQDTSGTATSACLIGPDGSAYVVGDYGYTQDLDAEGWDAYGLDQQTTLNDNEHEAGEPAPGDCPMGSALLSEAYEACNDDAERDGDCEGESGFSPALVAALPLCGGS